MIKVGILGSTGYAGSQLVRLLENHKMAKVVALGSHSYVGQAHTDIYQNLRHLDPLLCVENDIDKMADMCDVIFIALPHGMAGKLVTEEILEKTKVIDLGADFRIQDADEYEKWYGEKVHNPKILKEAVYGLSEIYRESIERARLVANPGCYTTCSILSLYPLVQEKVTDRRDIIIDAKSGTTGAGRELSLGTHFCEVNENMKAYKVGQHRHTAELEEQLSMSGYKKFPILFTPHLVPMNRGILTCSYLTMKKKYNYRDIQAIYEDYYINEHFVRLTKEGVLPETKWVKSSNFIDIGFVIDERTEKLIVIATIDNLIKGAAGQAIQNMNIMMGLDEYNGLESVPDFPI